MEKKHIVLFAVGKDRPGLVAAISKALSEMRCNIEDSSMTILKNQFAMILIVEPPPALSEEEFGKRIKEAAKSVELRVTFEVVGDEELDTSKWMDAERYVVSVFGEDRVGIVHRISSTLATYGVNIANVKTKLLRRKGRPNVFSMVLEVDIPPETNVEELEKDLKKVEEELRLDVGLREVTTAQM